jgi:hypothetical protein
MKDDVEEVKEGKTIHREGLKYLAVGLIAILLGAGGAYLAIYQAQTGEKEANEKAVTLAQDKTKSDICKTTPEEPLCKLADETLRDQVTAIPGTKGDKGDRGEQGIPGPMGPNGPKGDKGEQGIQGALGLPGLEGTPGPPGTNGPEGAAGATGADGIPGSMGPAGPQGEQGLQGPAGPEGAAGANGKDGADGAPGSDANVTLMPLSCVNDVLTITLSNGSTQSISVVCQRGVGNVLP